MENFHCVDDLEFKLLYKTSVFFIELFVKHFGEN